MNRSRQAFTLVEVLVAMALTMFVMVILSQAFVAGLDTFSVLMVALTPGRRDGLRRAIADKDSATLWRFAAWLREEGVDATIINRMFTDTPQRLLALL